MSIPEVNRAIKAWGWREHRQLVQQEQLVYILPTLIGALFNKEGYPKIYDVFPDDFNDIKNQDMLARLRTMASHFNQQFNEGEQHG